MADDLDVEALLEAPYMKGTPHRPEPPLCTVWDTFRRVGWETMAAALYSCLSNEA